MNRLQIEALLKEVREGQMSVNSALDRLKDLPFEDLGFAKVDHHRALRTGMPEVIFAAGKTIGQVAAIFERMAKAGGNVLATRASREAFEAVAAVEPAAIYHEAARAITLAQAPVKPGVGTIAVVCAGTSDLAGGRRSRRHLAADGQHNRVDCRRRCRRHSSAIGAEGVTANSARSDCVCGHGGRAANRRGGACKRPRDRRADERRLWCFVWWGRRPAGHAEHLCTERLSGEHRQRIRRRLHCLSDQPSVSLRPIAPISPWNR